MFLSVFICNCPISLPVYFMPSIRFHTPERKGLSLLFHSNSLNSLQTELNGCSWAACCTLTNSCASASALGFSQEARCSGSATSDLEQISKSWSAESSSLSSWKHCCQGLWPSTNHRCEPSVKARTRGLKPLSGLQLPSSREIAHNE